MRTITLSALVLFLSGMLATAQVADGISYQAVALDAAGEEIAGTDAQWNIIEDAQFDVRFTILEGSPEGTALYQEVHTAHTDPFGMFSVIIGHGDETGSGVYDRLTDLPWGVEKFFLKVEIDLAGEGSFTVMDLQQLMAVPFAFHALSAGTPSSIQAAPGHPSDKAIFSVLNSEGDTVFAVYESGVVISIEDDPGKGSRGGFAVGGFSQQKSGEYVEYLRVDPGDVRITIDDTPADDPAKGSRGGFAIGGFSQGKQDGSSDYFSLSPIGTLVQFDIDYDTGLKGSRGGFAVGGFSQQKSALTDYLFVGPDSVRIYIDDTPDDDPSKGSRGGFAVGGFSQGKQAGYDYLRIDPGFIRVTIDDTPDAKGSRGGFAVGGFSQQKSGGVDYLLLDAGSALFTLNQDLSKGSRGGFAVGGFSQQKDTGVTDYLTLSADSVRVYIDPDAAGRGGFGVVERDLAKGGDLDILFVTPGSTSVYLKESSKNAPEGFSVFNREGDLDDATRLFSVSDAGTYVATLFAVAPVVATAEVTVFAQTTAVAGGAVVKDGGAEITGYGVVYGTLASPTLTSGTRAESANIDGPGVFTVNLSGLQAGTRYYVRAYAVNSAGVAYGQQVEFTTLD